MYKCLLQIQLYQRTHFFCITEVNGWNFFPWNVWNSASKESTKKIEPVPKPRVAKQERWSVKQKEIIDLEETVCLPRYQCGKIRSSGQEFDQAYTDSINDLIVSKLIKVEKSKTR